MPTCHICKKPFGVLRWLFHFCKPLEASAGLVLVPPMRKSTNSEDDCVLGARAAGYVIGSTFGSDDDGAKPNFGGGDFGGGGASGSWDSDSSSSNSSGD